MCTAKFSTTQWYVYYGKVIVSMSLNVGHRLRWVTVFKFIMFMKLNIYCIFLRGKSALKIGCSITFQQPDVRQSGTSVKTIDMNFWWFYIGVLFADLVTLKGCGMGPWLVLVSPCFRENVIATCKIGSFLCSLDHLLQKNVIVLFFRKSNFKMALIWKKGYFWPSCHIF